MLNGLNHLTLSVSNLRCSFAFYCDVLGCKPYAYWDHGAYLTLGDLWLCLTVDTKGFASPASGYTHYAFSIASDHFAPFLSRLADHRVSLWQSNSSEGDSVYFLDPDGHKLEVHVGDLNTRLQACRATPYVGMVLFD